jgi:hypothetical protein
MIPIFEPLVFSPSSPSFEPSFEPSVDVAAPVLDVEVPVLDVPVFEAEVVLAVKQVVSLEAPTEVTEETPPFLPSASVT